MNDLYNQIYLRYKENPENIRLYENTLEYIFKKKCYIALSRKADRNTIGEFLTLPILSEENVCILVFTTKKAFDNFNKTNGVSKNITTPFKLEKFKLAPIMEQFYFSTGAGILVYTENQTMYYPLLELVSILKEKFPSLLNDLGLKTEYYNETIYNMIDYLAYYKDKKYIKLYLIEKDGEINLYSDKIKALETSDNVKPVCYTTIEQEITQILSKNKTTGLDTKINFIFNENTSCTIEAVDLILLLAVIP